jgi:hypothetical protein
MTGKTSHVSHVETGTGPQSRPKTEEEPQVAEETALSENDSDHGRTGADSRPEDGGTLEKTSTKTSAIDPEAKPPDGGLDAWLKVFGCFLIYSNIWYVDPSALRPTI